ncbi:HNH endonuclease [Aeromonas veronii]|uniref:HNH endonuclease n=1 Tax=Aeromonas veronii TaxID=654 RepID=UPI0038D2CB06
MGKLIFTSDDKAKMKAASTLGHNGWKLNKLKKVKSKIKKHKRSELNEVCAYCQRDTTGEYNLVLDIEHIIPKSIKVQHMFTMKNLTISCKRCNMEIKGSRTDFLISNIINCTGTLFKSRYYKFVHPNLDKIENHIERNVVQKGRARIVKYLFPMKTDKGYFTYDYFKLKELEIDSANQAQGGNKKMEIKNAIAAKAFRKLKDGT